MPIYTFLISSVWACGSRRHFLNGYSADDVIAKAPRTVNGRGAESHRVVEQLGRYEPPKLRKIKLPKKVF